MSHARSREVVLPLTITDDLIARICALRDAWRANPSTVPKGFPAPNQRNGNLSWSQRSRCLQSRAVGTWSEALKAELAVKRLPKEEKLFAVTIADDIGVNHEVQS